MRGGISFGPFYLDLDAGRLLRNGTEVPLRPKTWAVLSYMADNAGRLVTKNELLDAVWPQTAITEDMASKCIRELRGALGEGGRTATYLEVVHGRGFRFHVARQAAAIQAPSPSLPPIDSFAALGLADTMAPNARLSDLVGRKAELVVIEDALANALGARGSIVVIAGEPGIGKTRLLAAAMAAGIAREFTPLVGRCFEGDAWPPLWPWVQVIRACLRSQPADSLGPAANRLRQLLPELRVDTSAEGVHATIESLDAEQARLQLFDGIVALLQRTASRRPLLIALEDVHWIDPASLALLQAVARAARALPLLILATHRENESNAGVSLGSVFATLRREQAGQQIKLQGLDQIETSALLAALADAPVAPTLARAIGERTAGNPYFCGELWRHLVDEKAIRFVDGGWQGSTDTSGVPEGVSATLGRRLQRLSSNSLALLSAAAVCGVEFDFDVAAAAAGLDTAIALDGVDEAMSALLISDRAESVGQYRFNHALAAETLYHALSKLRRAHLHNRVGQELERRHAGTPNLDVAALAYHFIHGASVADADKALAYARQAAEQATAACSYEAAADHLEHGLSLLDQNLGKPRQADDEARRCELLLATAEAHTRAGNGPAARARFEQATALAGPRRDANALARAALGMATRWTFADATVIALLEDALSVVGDGNQEQRARLMARLAQSLYLLPNTRTRREQLCEQALLLARSTDNAGLIGTVLNDCLEALFHTDNLSEQETLATALYAASTIAGDRRLRLQAHAWRIVISMSRGHLRAADDEIGTLLTLAEEVRLPEFLSISYAFSAALQVARGQLETAEEQARLAMRLGERIDGYHAGLVGFVQLFTIRREQGRVLALESDDREIRFPVSSNPADDIFARTARWQLPFSLMEQNQLEQVHPAFAALMADFDSLPPENGRNSRLPSLGAASEVAARLGDQQAAERLLPLVEVYADQWTVTGFGSIVSASTRNALGLLTGTLGQYDTAIAHFERAVDAHDSEGAVVAQARTLANYARTLLGRNARGDRASAGALIERGLRLAERHGLVAARSKLHPLLAQMQERTRVAPRRNSKPKPSSP